MLLRPRPGRHEAARALTPRSDPRRLVPCQAPAPYASSSACSMSWIELVLLAMMSERPPLSARRRLRFHASEPVREDPVVSDLSLLLEQERIVFRVVVSLLDIRSSKTLDRFERIPK